MTVAIFKGKLFRVGDNLNQCHLISASGDGCPPGHHLEFDVDYGHPDLIVDPTDMQVAAAVNIAAWFELETEEEVARMRAHLRGEVNWNTGKPFATGTGVGG